MVKNVRLYVQNNNNIYNIICFCLYPVVPLIINNILLNIIHRYYVRILFSTQIIYCFLNNKFFFFWCVK